MWCQIISSSSQTAISPCDNYLPVTIFCPCPEVVIISDILCTMIADLPIVILLQIQHYVHFSFYDGRVRILIFSPWIFSAVSVSSPLFSLSWVQCIAAVARPWPGGFISFSSSAFHLRKSKMKQVAQTISTTDKHYEKLKGNDHNLIWSPFSQKLLIFEECSRT